MKHVPHALSARRARGTHQRVHRRNRRRYVARRKQRLAADEHRLGSSVRVVREPFQRTAGERGRCGQVVSLERNARRGRQQRTRACRELAAVIVQGAELPPGLVRLLEVVADQLVVLVQQPTGLAFEPARDALVELGSRLLEQPSVGSVADQRVVEPEHRLVDPICPGRLDELLAPQALEVRVEPHLHRSRRKLHDRAAVELLPDDRGQLEHRPFVRP